MKKIVVIGSLNMDFVVNIAKMPLVGETILADNFELIAGGKGANQAYAAGMLGADVTMLGAVGNDSYGDTLITSLKHANVHTEHIKQVCNESTGIALISVNAEGNNNIIVIQGANKLVDKAYIDSKIDVIRDCDIVIFQLEIPLDTVVYAAQKAKEFGKMVILDPAPAQKNIPDTLFKCVDLIKPNETELAILLDVSTDSPSFSSKENLKSETQKIKARGVSEVLVTLGGDGSYLNDANGEEHRFYTKDVHVVDTTAAGDSFTAAVAVSLAQGNTLPDAIKFADKVAQIVVTRKGAQSSIPSINEVNLL